MQENTYDIELQMHPYFDYYGLEQVVNAMDRNGISIAACEKYNGQVFPLIREMAHDLARSSQRYEVEDDSLMVRLSSDGRSFILPRAAELLTSDDFHLLTWGYDTIRPEWSAEAVIDDALSHEALVAFDHVIVDVHRVMRPISKEKEKDVLRLCIKYKGAVALEWNGYCRRDLRLLTFGHDVNRRARAMSIALQDEGYNIPVVTTTDLHARSPKALEHIGRAKVKVNLSDVSSGHALIQGIKNEILGGRAENTYRTVPLKHFLPHFVVPYMVEYAYNRLPDRTHKYIHRMVRGLPQQSQHVLDSIFKDSRG
jgi:hypothetical protein